MKHFEVLENKLETHATHFVTTDDARMGIELTSIATRTDGSATWY